MSDSAYGRRFTDDAVDSVLTAKSAVDITSALAKFSSAIEFAFFSATYSPISEVPQFTTYHNHPVGWFKESMGLTVDEVSNDPVLRHLGASALPMTWGQDTYVSAGLGPVWERCASYGIKAGVCLALRGPQNDALLIGLVEEKDRARPLKSPDVLGMLYFCGAAVLEQTRQMSVAHAREAPELKLLTQRELEVLKWCRDGKTAWEIGQILAISQPTAQFHIRNIITKLGVTSKQQAVIRAISYRLV